jgi:hypothetical protein
MITRGVAGGSSRCQSVRNIQWGNVGFHDETLLKSPERRSFPGAPRRR